MQEDLTQPICVLCSKGSPAYCIVMSGGYRDDVDAGLEIDYTGEGGQTNGKHVSCHACCLQPSCAASRQHHCSVKEWLEQSEAVTAKFTGFCVCSSEAECKEGSTPNGFLCTVFGFKHTIYLSASQHMLAGMHPPDSVGS